MGAPTRCTSLVCASALLMVMAYVYFLGNQYMAFVRVTSHEQHAACAPQIIDNYTEKRMVVTNHHNHTEEDATASSRRIVTVFSTGCSPSQDWQAQALLHNHRKLGIPGDLVRLMSCCDPNYVLPKHSYPKYRVVWLPDVDVDHPDDPYSPRNRPAGLAYWLGGHSNDTNLPHDRDVLVQVDPDMIFLSNRINVSLVQTGVGIGSEYGLHKTWLKDELARATCQGKCHSPEEGYNPSYGHPMVLTAGDTRRHAKVWMNVTEQMRLLKKEWMTEMFSNVVAHRLVGNQIVVLSTMLSSPDSQEHSPYFEPWNTVPWHAVPPEPGVWVAHYCQKYTLGDSFTWYKHDYRSLDIRNCDRTQNFPTPSMEALAEMERWRNGNLQKQDNVEEARRSRNVWMLDHAWEEVRTAIAAYYEEFC